MLSLKQACVIHRAIRNYSFVTFGEQSRNHDATCSMCDYIVSYIWLLWLTFDLLFCVYGNDMADVRPQTILLARSHPSAVQFIILIVLYSVRCSVLNYSLGNVDGTFNFLIILTMLRCIHSVCDEPARAKIFCRISWVRNCLRSSISSEMNTCLLHHRYFAKFRLKIITILI